MDETGSTHHPVLPGVVLYVGYTRVSDYKHHPGDVLVGLLQGPLIAVLTMSAFLSHFY